MTDFGDYSKWITAKGERIHVTDLSDDHLKNILKKLETTGFGHMSCDDEEWWRESLMDELRRRKGINLGDGDPRVPPVDSLLLLL